MTFFGKANGLALTLGLVGLWLGAGLVPVAAASSPFPAAPQFVQADQVAAFAGQLMASARKPCEVQLEMYELGNPQLISALIAAKQRGCSMQVTLDNTESQSQAAGRQLKAAGIKVSFPRLPRSGLDHVKALVIDGQATLIGGVNWGTGSSDTADADLYFPSDPAASARLSADHKDLTTRVAPGVADNPGALEGVAIQDAMDNAINSAKSQVLILGNYLSSYNVQDALAAAVKRGVSVQALINPLGYGAKAAAKWLSEHGVSVRYAPDSPYLHSKVLVADNTLVMGSANFSYSGLNYNREMDVSITNSVLVSRVLSWGESLYAGGGAA